MLIHVSLCSGIGGIDLAAEWAGFKTIAQCEIDEYASKVLAKNFKGVLNLHDIRTVTNSRLTACGIDPESVTLLSAGFPCQPYSLAGKGLGDSDSRDLWGEVAKIVREVRPKCSSLFSEVAFERLREASAYKEVNLLLSMARALPAPRCGVLRNDYGLSPGVDRLRCLGNAVVPQQIYPLLAEIAAYERGGDVIHDGF